MATTRPLLDGTEAFRLAGRPTDFTVLDFWRWADSDLLSNALRGRLAQCLVARALDVAFEPRREWLTHDLTTRDGIKTEVNSCPSGRRDNSDNPGSSTVMRTARAGGRHRLRVAPETLSEVA